MPNLYQPKSKTKPTPTIPLYVFLITLFSCLAIIALMFIAFLQLSCVPTGTDESQNTNSTNNSSSNSTNSNNTNDTDTTSTYDTSQLRPLDSQGVLDFFSDKKTGFLLAGRPTCPHCQDFVPILAKVVREHGTTVYYYDTDAANADSNKKAEALTALDITGVPTFMYIKNGIITSLLGNTKSEPALLDFINQNSQN